MAEALRKHQATNVDELLAGQQRLQAVLDSIDDGLLMIDRAGSSGTPQPGGAAAVGLGRLIVLAKDSGRQRWQRPELDQQLQLVLRGGTPGAGAGGPEYRGRWRVAAADV